jgi:hypothetical protein
MADLVAGKLRRSQRVHEPLVIKPVHEIGRYGGPAARLHGPGDSENGTARRRTSSVLGIH